MSADADKTLFGADFLIVRTSHTAIVVRRADQRRTIADLNPDCDLVCVLERRARSAQ